MVLEYVCAVCGTRHSREQAIWRCSCGGPLELTDSPPLRRQDIDRARSSLWRYGAALPPGLPERAVSYEEGWTPLVAASAWGSQTWMKLDYLAPSGSFKDRGTTVLLSEMLRLGVDHVLEDSSGNAGASMATYCARAQVHCDIYVPASASAGKIVQIELTGATVRRIPGERADTTTAAMEVVNSGKGPVYASHNWHPLFIDGVKTVGYEIWEQLEFRAPEAVVAPAGNGSIILGLARAFSELIRAGEIERMPKIIAVQAAACAPLATAFTQGLSEPAPIQSSPTLAEGIISLTPIRGKQILEIVRSSGGAAVAVSEDAIIRETQRLATQGFFVEPTSAVVTAALPELRSRGILAESDETVCILSGSGLKASQRLAELFSKP